MTAVAGAIALVAGACGGGGLERGRADDLYRHVPDAHLRFTRATARSSESAHAASTRAGRVDVSPHTLADLAVVASIADGACGVLPPRFIEVPEGTACVLLERPDRYDGCVEVRSPAGALVSSARGEPRGSHVLARADRDGEPFYAAPNVDHAGETLAISFAGDEARSLVITRSAPHPHGGAEPYFTAVTSGHPGSPDPIRRYGWGFHVSEAAVGAIDGAGHAVLALPSGRLVVLGSAGDDQDRGTIAVDTRIDGAATDLSIVPPFALVVRGGGDAGAAVAERSGDFTRSRIDAHRADGTLAWRADVPFLVGQPPIDGNGCIYVVGRGITALDLDGRTLWSLPSTVPLRAQAFGDGTLAVVGGTELQIIGRDGVLRQTLHTADELTTYPAIASDGAIWIASARTLHVAR